MQTTELKNTFHSLFEGNKERLGIYFSAGYPFLDSTEVIIKALENSGADFIEVGMPYSDPLADGPTIEACHARALANGMTMDRLFEQLQKLKGQIKIPILLMGYFNPVYRYGIEKFCKNTSDAGIDTLILPDMPVDLYKSQFQPLFDKYGISIVFLATPDTPDDRLQLVDEMSNPFIYLVSSSSTTGQTKGIDENQISAFEKIKLKLKKPVCVGFGISSNTDFHKINKCVDGAIVGSAFLKSIEGVEDKNMLESKTEEFIKNIRS